MALDVVLPSSIQERPHPRGRRQCSCCPYGYHIDLDFVRYCESITTAQLMPSVAVKRSRWKNVRKKRASREALLGLVTTPQDTVDSMPQRCETPVMASADIGDDLRKAVMDFEKTLRHASLPRMSSKKERNGYDSLDHSDYTPVKAHSNSIYSSVTLPRNFIKSDRDGVTGALPIEEMNFANVNSNNASAETLQNIREQMAASLRRMRELEEHIKVIPRLKEQIGNLRKDNEKLRNELNIKAAKEQQISSDQITFLKKENDSLKKEIEGMEIHRISEDQLEGFRKENEKLRTEIKNLEAKQVQHIRPLTADRITSTNDLVHSRAAAVGCTVLTREVGVSPNIYLTRSIGVGASSQIEPSEPNQSDSISLNKILGTAISFKHKNASVMTDVPYPESQALQIESPKPLKRTEVQSMATSTDLKMGEIVSKSEMSSQLQELKHKMASPPKVSIRVNTILQHDQIFTQNELDERAARFAKTYENNFLSTNLARKSSMVSCAAQTMAKPARKHFGLQAQPKVSDASVVAKPKIIAAAVQAMVLMQEIGVSDDTTNSYACEKCKAKKISVGTLFPDRSDQLLLRINSSPEMKAPKKACISKSTDTRGLRMTKDVSQNTLKKKLVSTSMETGDYTCSKCSSQTPPKPSAVPLPAKRPSYLPISVSRVRTPVTPSPQLQQMLQNEGSNSDSGSDDGTYTIHQDVGASVKDDVFHDQSPKPRSYSPRRDPSKEMKGALKVLNDALQKSPGGDIPKHVKTAVNIVQQEWFKVSSVATANPLDVEYYLDCFEEISGTLLEYVVNMTDVSGNTAMHYAVSNGNFDVVSILLDSKVCNINKLNTAGYTCIMLVALTKVKSETDREVVRRLFNMADVNIRAKEHGQTALMLAVSHGRIDTVELLLEAGADINIQDEDGSTALMCAAEHGYIEIVKLLLAQPDCDLSITDFDGTTALAIAMEAGNRDIGVLLYAQEHFSRGSSPYTSMKHKRSKSTTPTLKSRPTTPSHSSQKKDSEQES